MKTQTTISEHTEQTESGRPGPHIILYRMLIRWAFDRFYHEFAWTYDTVAWLVSRGLWYRWTLAALPYLKGKVLELGCGTGFLQHTLAMQHPGKAVGIDASPHMLALTHARLRKTQAITRLIRARTERLPFASHSFDTVLSTFPSEYIVHPDTLNEIQRVLVPTGQLILVDAAHFTHKGVYEWAIYLAYWLTSQGSVKNTLPTIPYQGVFEQASFTIQHHYETVGASEVMVLVAKMANNGT